MMLVMLFLPAFVIAADLIACPDCGKQVSSRAVMCPQCGCPGDAIAHAARQHQTEASMQRPAFFDSVVEVSSERGCGWGTVVSEGGAVYVLTTLDILGADSLEVRSLWTNRPVAYTTIELADDCSLVRLRLLETNLHALSRTPLEGGGFFVIKDPPTNTLRLISAKLDPKSSSAPVSDGRFILPGSPVLNSESNLVAIVSTAGLSVAFFEVLTSDRKWIPVQPRAFREQMSNLIKGRQLHQQQAPGEQRRQAAQKLHSTAWQTTFLKTSAEQLAKQLEQGP